MIIECIGCKKKFEVDSNLIPSTGRNIQCGSCDKIWFFDPKKEDLSFKEKIEPSAKKQNLSKKIRDNSLKDKSQNIDKTEKKKFEITKYKVKSQITLSKFLSYILVIIISFVALLILIDTFKSIIYEAFPGLESLLFSLFEVLKDIKLFIKDLI